MTFVMPPNPDHFYILAVELLCGLSGLCVLCLLAFKVVRGWWGISDEREARRKRQSKT